MSQLFYNYPVEEYFTLDPNNNTGCPYNNMIILLNKNPRKF